MSWNHNTHHHGFVIGAVPVGCGRELDVGCGRGVLARKLALHCKEVVGIDSDSGCLPNSQQNVAFIHGDVLTHPFQPATFDFVSAVATLHHLPLRRALEQFSDLLEPGGVLAVIGLYRMDTPVDYALSAAALPVSLAIRSLRGEEQVGAPMQNPTETLREIRREAAAILPGAVVRRQFFFRYTIMWRKPQR